MSPAGGPARGDGPGAFCGRAPGKLILCGEHAVVYGHRAIAAAVPLHAEVSLRPRPGPITLDTPGDPRLLEALRRVLPGDGFGVSITSELPMGAGMGSSAAIAVATVRALGAVRGETPDVSRCFEGAWAMERVFHGNPSGVDQAVSARGGLLAYRRDPLEVEPLAIPRPLTLVVVNTGPPAASTAEMVARVRAREPWEALARIGAVVGRVRAALLAGAPIGLLGALLDENHALLREIGVSTPELDAACIAMRRAGARGAKLAGAGGGGVAFGLVEGDPEPVRVEAARWGEAWVVEVGTAAAPAASG